MGGRSNGQTFIHSPGFKNFIHFFLVLRVQTDGPLLEFGVVRGGIGGRSSLWSTIRGGNGGLRGGVGGEVEARGGSGGFGEGATDAEDAVVGGDKDSCCCCSFCCFCCGVAGADGAAGGGGGGGGRCLVIRSLVSLSLRRI